MSLPWFAGRALPALVLSAVSIFATASAGTVSAPSYTPLKVWSAAGGARGTAVKGFYASTNTTYSTDLAGPFGGSTTAKISQQAGSNWFGGEITGAISLKAGSDIWIRVYQFFPSSFCFSYGGGGDGWGGTKWFRAQTSGGRSTVELGTASPNSNPTYAFQRAPACGTVTAAYGDISEMGAGNQPFPDYTAAPLVRGKWQALQTHWHFGDSDGYVEGWVDDTYLGRSNHTTLKSGATVDGIVYGDYWNGGFPVDQAFYYDDVIVTAQKPNTVDSGGRPFIHPSHKVSDFSGQTQPSAPANVSVQ